MHKDADNSFQIEYAVARAAQEEDAFPRVVWPLKMRSNKHILYFIFKKIWGVFKMVFKMVFEICV